MSDRQLSSRTIHCAFLVQALVVVAAGLPSCSDEGETEHEFNARTEDTSDRSCLWETNELLSRVNAQSGELVDCGLFLGQQPLDNDCFASGLEADDSVQITIDNCIDCMIHSTYVSTSSGDKFHLYREADFYGDAVRVVRVESCMDFIVGEGSGANCAGPAVLYSCSDPLPDPSNL